MTSREVFDLRKRRKYWAIGVAISIVTAFTLLQPMQVWTQAPPPVTTQNQGGELQQILEKATECIGTTDAVAAIPIIVHPFILDPQEMNTVYSPSNNEVKTIHVDKEVAECLVPGTTPTRIIINVSIFTEIKEALEFQSPISKIFEVVYCLKDADTGDVLGCFSQKRVQDEPDVTACHSIPVPNPIEMNTVIGAGKTRNIVKTIEAEKEIFRCKLDIAETPPTVIKDVVIFTEIFEDIGKNTIIGKKFEATTCVKLAEPNPPRVLGCSAD